MNKYFSNCDGCGRRVPSGPVLCEDCCEHEEIEDGMCLDCGKDMREELAAQAEFQRDCYEDR